MLNFLKTLFKKSSTKNTVLYVSEDESLSRFIFNKNEMNKSGPKAQAFYPSMKNYETSVFRKDMMKSLEYEKTKNNIAKLRKRNMKAVAIIKAQVIRNNHLDVLPEESEHKWHANIVNWPQDKSKFKNICQKLARDASLE